MNCLVVSRSRRVGVALLVAAIVAGCRDETPVKGATNGGTVIVAVPTDVHTLYPPHVVDAFDQAVVHSVYDKLADIGDSLNTIGDADFIKQLAADWTWAPDSLSIAFKLNSAARWHDGKPVRAEDVRFTFRAYTDSLARGPNSDYLSNIDSVSVRDSLTPVVWFKRRMPQQFFQATYYMYIMPSHLLSGIALDKLKDDPIGQTPMGSGRFRLGQRVPQQRIELVADTANYLARAKLDRVIFAIYDGAPNATLSVFGGDADFFEKLLVQDLPQVARTPTLRAQAFAQSGYGYLAFNLNSRTDRNAPNPIFGDVNVRRALSMAVDRENATRAVLDTFGLPGIGPSPRALMPNSKDLKQIGFDREHARALLDSAGWVLPAGKEVREKNGVPLAFSMSVSSTSVPRQTFARSLENQFRGVGANATVRVLEGTVLREEVSRGGFDSYLGALVLTPGLQGILQSWGTRGIGGRNFGRYSNPVFDATIDSALSSSRPAEANKLWLRGLQQIINDAPAIWLYEDINVGVMHKRIQTPPMRGDAWFAKLAEWSIDPAQRIDRDR